MADIIKRLKVLGKVNGRQFSIYMEAAAEIKRLRALVHKLANVVEFQNSTHNSGEAKELVAEARAAAAALKETGE